MAEQVRQPGGEALVYITDVTRPAGIQAMIARTMETYGRSDVLYSNAGLMRTAPVEQVSHESSEQMSTEMVKPQDVAEPIAFIINRPRHFNINEVLFRPTQHVF